MNLLKSMFKNRDRRVSVIVFVFAFIWLKMSKQIVGIFNYAGDRDPGSRLFPIMIGILLLVTSIGKFITCNQEEEGKFYETNKGWLKLLVVFALLSAYVFLFKILGYLLSTFLVGVLCVLLLKEDRKVRWFSPILFSAILTISMYLLFAKVLSIVLPTGTLWQLIF